MTPNCIFSTGIENCNPTIAESNACNAFSIF
jgi:hypothetical protein